MAGDGTDAADIGPNRAGLGLSPQVLTQAGFGPRQTVTVDAGTASQATFVMPRYAVRSVDNVIADMQTIDLAKPTTKKFLDLLMVSTRGSLQSSASTAFTFIYANDKITNTADAGTRTFTLPFPGYGRALAVTDVQATVTPGVHPR